MRDIPVKVMLFVNGSQRGESNTITKSNHLWQINTVLDECLKGLADLFVKENMDGTLRIDVRVDDVLQSKAGADAEKEFLEYVKHAYWKARAISAQRTDGG